MENHFAHVRSLLAVAAVAVFAVVGCGDGGDGEVDPGPVVDGGPDSGGADGGAGTTCEPDPPSSCTDLGATDDEVFLGCCGSDGNAYWCTEGGEISFDDCSAIGTGGCCFETYNGKPAYVCCGTGS